MTNPIQSIVIIGTGNVAWQLGSALVASGVTIAHVAGRDEKKAKDLANHLHCNSISTINNNLPEADMYLIAVKDDAIHEVASAIQSPNRLLVHTAGAVSIDRLSFDKNQYGAIWPMETLTKQHLVADFKKTLFAVTGSDPIVEEVLLQISNVLSDRTIGVTDNQRSLMHMTAVWINNYTNHLYDIAYQLLKENGLTFDLFIPLIEDHVQKLKSSSPNALQTGPAKRGDMATLMTHKEILHQHPDWEALYDTLAQSILHQHIKQ